MAEDPREKERRERRERRERMEEEDKEGKGKNSRDTEKERQAIKVRLTGFILQSWAWHWVRLHARLALP